MDHGSDYERFFADEYALVVFAVLPIVGDHAEAESISQDAFLKALLRWRRLRRYDSPGAWVRRVAIRDAVRAAERAARSSSLSEVDITAEPSIVEGDDDLDRALAALSPRQRACVVLRHVEGWAAADIGEALGCSASTVRVHLHRGLAALSRQLQCQSKEEAVDDH